MNKLHTVAAALAFTLLASTAHAQTAPVYPTRTVKLIVDFAAGGGVDIVAQRVAQKMQESYGAASAGFQLSTELFKLKSGATGQPIVFRSTNEAVTNIIGEQVTYGFAEPPPSLPQVQADKAGALA